MKILIKDIINEVMQPEIHIDNTVDGLEYGDLDTVVKGVIVTFLATQRVIEAARATGVNLIISHEGIGYSHRPDYKQLECNSVYIKKVNLINESGIAVFRNHDHIHRCTPDRIMVGLISKLKWNSYEVFRCPMASVVEIPEISLDRLIAHVKSMLGISYVRFLGDLSMTCSKIGILAGYRGSGQHAIPLFEQQQPDVVIYGEGPEWETPEYVRDSILQGNKKALIVLGHAESEMPAMNLLAEQLKQKFPAVKVEFIANEPIFDVI